MRNIFLRYSTDDDIEIMYINQANKINLLYHKVSRYIKLNT